jgi:hypothetical protein
MKPTNFLASAGQTAESSAMMNFLANPVDILV